MINKIRLLLTSNRRPATLCPVSCHVAMTIPPGGLKVIASFLKFFKEGLRPAFP